MVRRNQAISPEIFLIFRPVAKNPARVDPTFVYLFRHDVKNHKFARLIHVALGRTNDAFYLRTFRRAGAMRIATLPARGENQSKCGQNNDSKQFMLVFIFDTPSLTAGYPAKDLRQ
jgi:hypothetical protein